VDFEGLLREDGRVGELAPRERSGFSQRAARRRVRKLARKSKGEPLGPEDWGAYFTVASHTAHGPMGRLLRALPSSPRCGVCGAPFAGIGGRLIAPLGFRPSRKSPGVCATCVEAAPPGGMTTKAGILFADIRGFTSISERSDPEQVSALLRRFYACAEQVIFPDAVIDKLIGDEVMALYISAFGHFEEPSPVMLAHARELLRAIGYGTPSGPFAEVGIGLDYGEAFVGNVGGGAYNDFTAIGDVVNVASRLQGEAHGGEIVASARVVDRLLPDRPGERLELTLKGKAAPVVAYRIAA
jgi:adenylate cyclase